MKFLTFTFAVLTVVTFGQDLSDFNLNSQGDIPQKLLLSDEEKLKLFEEELLRGGHLSGLDLEDGIKRSVRSHNHLRNTGQLIFGNDIQLYLDSLIQVICKKLPELNDTQFDVFLSQNPSVNASCYFHKEIHVNIGLLAKLETEGELMFVLCHEIAHYFLEHTNRRIHHHREQNKDEPKKKRRKKKETEQSVSQILESLHVSKSHELEADSLGVELMTKIGYSTEFAISTLNKFLISDQSYFQYSGAVDSIFSGIANIPMVFKRHKLIEINRDPNYFDEFHTHPNVQKRIEAVKKQLADSTSLEQNDKRFLQIQQNARLAHLKCLFLDKEYVSVLYNSTYLKSKYPRLANEFTKWQALSLFAIAKHKNYDLLGTIILPINKTPGFEQELTSFFKQCSKKQVLGLTAKFIFHQKLNSDKNASIYEGLLNDLVSELNPTGRMKLSSNLSPSKEEQELVKIDPRTISDKEIYELQIKLRDFWKYSWDESLAERVSSPVELISTRKKVRLYPLLFISDVEKREELLEYLRTYEPKKKDSVSIDLGLSETFFKHPTSIQEINFHKKKFEWILQASQNEGLFQPLINQLNIFNFDNENVVVDFVVTRPHQLAFRSLGNLLIHDFVSVRPNYSSNHKEIREYKKSIEIGKFQKKYEQTILDLR